MNLVEYPGAADRRRAERAFPGAVWFPIVDRAGKPLWPQCPSIVARNADVMAWVQQELDARRVEGRFPTQLVLGRHAGESESYKAEGAIFPFEGAGRTETDVPGRTTVDAMRKVEFADKYDLRGRRAYERTDDEPIEFKRVVLARGSRGTRVGSRDGIYVYEALSGERVDEAIGPERELGMLRPVQRYVLAAGLERAHQINRLLSATLREAGDEWGFVRVRKGGAPQAVTVTPPIIEQLHAGDLDDCEYKLDFVVCDGNHRIVEKVWNGRAPMAAIAVLGELPQPYYARPFGRLEWEATAENELAVTPQLASKYLVRTVSRDDLDDEARGILQGLDDRDLYRRYYRDLTKGFGYMGGQGGRFV